MNLEKRREDIQLGFRRERVIAALIAQSIPVEVEPDQLQIRLPGLDHVGFMSDQASKALFGY